MRENKFLTALFWAVVCGSLLWIAFFYCLALFGPFAVLGFLGIVGAIAIFFIFFNHYNKYE